jgi:hypothetical protein
LKWGLVLNNNGRGYHMKRAYLPAAVIFSVAVMFTGCKMTEEYQNSRFSTLLSGDQEVPAFTTKAHGRLTLEHRDQDKTMYYRLDAGQITDVTGAHIHLGKPGESGPVIISLFSGPKKNGEFNGTLAEGTFDSDALLGPLAKKTLNELINEIRRGNAYVNIHTDSHPDGEIRGQIQ